MVSSERRDNTVSNVEIILFRQRIEKGLKPTSIFEKR